ncbi:MAG: hypothetical protein ACYC6N_20670 [Pirellulaceae bacterium]
MVEGWVLAVPLHAPDRLMIYCELCILLPCHSLEDFPLHYEGEEAAGILAAWTALWHPALLAAAGSGPKWRRGNSPPSVLEGRLILAPSVSLHEIPADFAARAATEGAVYIPGDLPREKILEQALGRTIAPTVLLDDDVAADFLALGYAYLQIELLTRQMRYSTNLDETRFFQQVVAGARAAVAGNSTEAKAQLVACFNLLAQERDHYYAVDAYMLDLVLVESHTIGSSLVEQLAAEIPLNVVLTGQLLQVIDERAPESLAALRRGLDEGRVGLMGGEASESRSPLNACETVLEGFHRGLALFDACLAARPRVHARRRFGVSVLYPQLLQRLGYLGALHTVLGEGRYPEGSQVKIRWQGPDHSALDTIGRLPLDAARPETFLKLASKLGETMDMDHVATLCLAHWPGQVSPWYHDLRRIARYGAILGKFVTVDQYFRDTDYPGTSERFKADQYQSPYLNQAVSRQQHDPISTSVRYWRRQASRYAAHTLETLIALVGQRPLPSHAGERMMGEPDTNDDVGHETDRQQAVQASLDDQLGKAAEWVRAGEGPPVEGYVVFNPSSVVRRVGLDLPRLSRAPEVARPVYAAATEGAHRYVVADIPAMGYAWIQGAAAAPVARRSLPLLADGLRLCNEYFEAHVNPTTGALQSLREFEKRGNRLSQQLAFRMPRSVPGRQGPCATYSVMAAETVEVTVATSVVGEIMSAGRLLNQRGESLATFRQRLRVWRGSRVLQMSIELQPLAHPGDDPWDSYYACRFAWADETAALWRGAPELRERAEAKRFEAPLYVEIDDGNGNVVLLTGGLPFHRRTDARMLDSLLLVRGERATQFDIGIGLDVKYPWHEATAFLTPPLILPRTAAAPGGPAHGWLFHVDRRNLAATSWTPLIEAGEVSGFRVRLLETAGRTVHARLSAFRSIGTAHKMDFAGQSQGACSVRDGAIELDVGAHEWVELEARW